MPKHRKPQFGEVATPIILGLAALVVLTGTVLAGGAWGGFGALVVISVVRLAATIAKRSGGHVHP